MSSLVVFGFFGTTLWFCSSLFGWWGVLVGLVATATPVAVLANVALPVGAITSLAAGHFLWMDYSASTASAVAYLVGEALLLVSGREIMRGF